MSALNRPTASVAGSANSPSGTLPAIPGVDSGNPVLGHLDSSYTWYNQNAIRTMHNHFFLRTMQLLLASAIPVTQILMSGTPSRATAGVLGALIAILQGIDSLHRYGEHYVSWRATAQDLLRERFLFSAQSGPYANMPQAQALVLLATRVDAIEATEHQQWQSGEASIEAGAGGQQQAAT
jgi:hypothetical protein